MLFRSTGSSTEAFVGIADGATSAGPAGALAGKVVGTVTMHISFCFKNMHRSYHED